MAYSEKPETTSTIFSLLLIFTHETLNMGPIA